MNNECKHKPIMDDIDNISPYSESGPVICPDCGQDVREIVQRIKFNEYISKRNQLDTPNDGLL